MRLPVTYDAEQQAIFDADGDCILTMTNSDFHAPANDVHARQIVAAVNAHEALVKACEALPLDVSFEDAADFKDHARQFMYAMDLARLALAKK